jgi:Excalibur calcium-binding domain
MGLGKSHLRVIANPDNPERLFRTLNRQYRRYKLRKFLRRFGLLALATTASCAAVWAFLSFESLSGLVPGASPEVRVWRPGSSGPSSPSVSVWQGGGSFRNCAAARAAGAAPLRRGQPGYSSHLDADGDGIACEWSWRNWFW